MQHICSSLHIKEIYFKQFVVFFPFESMKNMTTTSEVAQHFLTQHNEWVSYNMFRETYVSCFIVCAFPLKFIDLLHHTNISYFMQHVSSNLFHRCALCSVHWVANMLPAIYLWNVFYAICFIGVHRTLNSHLP